MGKKEEISAATSVGLNVSASYLVRTLIEKILYELAEQHAADADTACKISNRNDELVHTIQAIIIATACLEAFINQEAIQVLGQGFDEYDKGYIDAWGKVNKKGRSYPSLEDKWCDITKRICNKEFDKGKKPFQNFHDLIQLRNEILHYKAMSAPPVPSRWQGVSGSVTPERAKFTANVANDAVEGMKAMLEQFHIMTGKQKPKWIK
jgi:hypothetical protein